MRLHPIRTGEVLAPPQLLERAPGYFATPRALGVGVPKSQFLWIPVVAFLVEHPSEGPVLIDTGLPAAAAADMRAAAGPVADRLYDLRMTPGDGIGPQLRARGVDPADVKTVLMTHLHFDHAAGMPELGNATFSASAREWQAADAGALKRLLGGYHRAHYEGRDRRALDVDRGERWGAFEHTLDVFGDGSVRMLSTPGHTLGHCSFAVALDGREVLITGDLAYTRATVYGGAEPGSRASAKLLGRSLEQLRKHVRGHPDTLVIPGHDPEAWAELDPVYGADKLAE